MKEGQGGEGGGGHSDQALFLLSVRFGFFLFILLMIFQCRFGLAFLRVVDLVVVWVQGGSVVHLGLLMVSPLCLSMFVFH